MSNDEFTAAFEDEVPLTNTPAFPSHEGYTNSYGQLTARGAHEGMTLRDYFAAKALQGTFTSPIPSTDCEKEYIAMHAYKMADAMLKARGEV